MKKTFGTTNNGHTPVTAILFCGAFGLLTFVGLCDTSFDQVKSIEQRVGCRMLTSSQPILTLSSFFTGTLGCVYASECVAYLRFKSG